MYIFEISCLSVASFAIIFSHSEGCLFTLLIVGTFVFKMLNQIVTKKNPAQSIIDNRSYSPFMALGWIVFYLLQVWLVE